MRTRPLRQIKNRVLTQNRNLWEIAEALKICGEHNLALQIEAVCWHLGSAATRIELRIDETRDRRGAKTSKGVWCGNPNPGGGYCPNCGHVHTAPSTREPPVDPDSDVPPVKASETPQHDFRGPTVACRCGWFGHPNALAGLKCPKCSAEFK